MGVGGSRVGGDGSGGVRVSYPSSGWYGFFWKACGSPGLRGRPPKAGATSRMHFRNIVSPKQPGRALGEIPKGAGSMNTCTWNCGIGKGRETVSGTNGDGQNLPLESLGNPVTRAGSATVPQRLATGLHHASQGKAPGHQTGPCLSDL